nr:radical SAM protein [Ruminiclostridium cellulolyticum]
MFVPHKGCPFDCIFCNQKIISGQIHESSEEEIRSTIESHLETSGDAYVEIGFYGGSFTGISLSEQEWYLKIGYSYIKDGKVKQIRLSTRPDYINPTILDLLERYGVKTIELGVQSLDYDVLKCTNRGHGIEEVLNAAMMIKDRGFSLGIQTMIGLPGDTRAKAVATAKKVVELSPNIVRIYPTLVIKNTFLQKLYYDGRYQPLTIEEAVDISAELLDIYEKHRINVIRIGLQPTDNISESGEIVAGPFHPAFRQLVESRLALTRMRQYIIDYGLDKLSDIVIECNPKLVSNIIGQKRMNIHTLKNEFNFKNIRIMEKLNVEKFLIMAT